MLKSGSASRRRSLRWSQRQSSEALTAEIERLLERCDRALQKRSPEWIGHCKAMLNVQGKLAYASLGMAGAPAVWAGGPLPPTESAELTLYAAIYGMPDDQVASALDEALASHPEPGLLQQEG